MQYLYAENYRKKPLFTDDFAPWFPSTHVQNMELMLSLSLNDE